MITNLDPINPIMTTRIHKTSMITIMITECTHDYHHEVDKQSPARADRNHPSQGFSIMTSVRNIPNLARLDDHQPRPYKPHHDHLHAQDIDDHHYDN